MVFEQSEENLMFSKTYNIGAIIKSEKQNK